MGPHFAHTVQQAPGFYSNGHTDVDSLILEARAILAARYGWQGRSVDVFECFHGQRSIVETLAQWDAYNDDVEQWRRVRTDVG